jgi:hypothetical protein
MIHRLTLDGVAGRTLQGPGHAGSHPEFVVCRIHVDLGLVERNVGDIADDDIDLCPADVCVTCVHSIAPETSEDW